MPRQDFGPGRTEQHEAIVFGLFGRDWACVPVTDAAPGITRLGQVGDVARWRWTYEMLVAVSELVVERTEFDMALLTHQPDADTVTRLAAWLADEYGKIALPALAEGGPQPMRERIEAALGPQDWDAKDTEAIWQAITDTGAEVAY